MTDQKQTLYDVAWQTLRVSLLAANSAGEGFNTEQGTVRNITTLRKYLGKDPSVDQLWRVLNLLNAVRMGNSGQGQTDSPRDKAIKKFRDEVSQDYKKKPKTFSPPSAESVQRDLSSTSSEVLKRINDNLTNNREKSSVMANRPELAWFLQLLREEIQSRVGSMSGA